MLFLSYSKIKIFQSCPRAYRYRYIDHVKPEFLPDYFILGELVHQSVAKAEKEGEDVEIVYKKLSSEFDLKREHLVEGLSMVKNWKLWKAARPKAEKVLSVELPFELFNGDGVAFKGKIDRLSYHPEDDTFCIIDYKTGKSKTPRKRIKSSLQLGLYALAVKVWYGDDARAMASFLYLKDLDKRGIYVRDDVIHFAQDKLYEAYIKIKKETLFPRKKSWQCKLCQYKITCGEDI